MFGLSGKTDQVLAGQWSTDLLHLAALAQPAEVNDEETGILEQRADPELRLRVVTGREDHTLAARLAWIGSEHGGGERVTCLHHTGWGDEIGDNFARRAPVEVARVKVVGRVDHDPPLPFQPLDRLRH